MGEILPTSDVKWCETAGDKFLDLFPSEATAMVGAGHKRLAEFMTVRWCARQALVQLGHPHVPIIPGSLGAPVWPPGVIGSMTHCSGYRAAVIARTSDLSSVGIDAEPDLALPNGVLDIVALPSERMRLPSDGGLAWDRLLFSAKESTYKAGFPLGRESVEFHEIEIILSTAGTFTSYVRTPAPSLLQGMNLAGRWTARGGLILTAVAVSAGRAAAGRPR